MFIICPKNRRMGTSPSAQRAGAVELVLLEGQYNAAHGDVAEHNDHQQRGQQQYVEHRVRTDALAQGRFALPLCGVLLTLQGKP